MAKSPTTAPSKCETSSTTPHTPTAGAWPHTLLSTYQRVPSPNLLAWAGPYACGRTRSTPTSTQVEPAMRRTEAANGHYRTRQTRRQRLPQPHQLPAPNAPHRRRPRCLHQHTTRKSSNTRNNPFKRTVHKNQHLRANLHSWSLNYLRAEYNSTHEQQPF